MSTALASPSPADDRPLTGAAPSRWADVAAFIGGGLAAALGIAVAELIAGLAPGAPSLVIAIGDLVIENQPPGAKELIVELFGTNNKLALNVGIVLATLLVAGLLGVAGRRRWGIPVVGFVVAGAVGLVAALAQSLTDPLLALVTVVAAIGAALVALRMMLRATGPTWAGSAGRDPAAAAAAQMPEWDRRRFLQISGGVAVGSLVVGLVGRNLLDHRPGGAVEGATLPTAAGPVPEVPAAASLDVAGITPIVTPNESFYR
ncbi:MAG TPA: hypothetical protein VFF55_11675, partial [Candidatus Deferrimicrobium sp.]|nr:hypothetical protein [Candidatus Deferrimicrobium sp.]